MLEATLIAGSLWPGIPRFDETTPVFKPLVVVYLGQMRIDAPLCELMKKGQECHYYPLAANSLDEPIRRDKLGLAITCIPLDIARDALKMDRRIEKSYHTLPVAVAALDRLWTGPERDRIHVALYWC